MRTSTVFSVSALAVALVAGGVFLTPSFAQDNRRGQNAERPWLSIPQLSEKLSAAGYRDIEEIEREHGGYEVRTTDRDGRRVKLRLNPWTGEVEDRDRQGGKRERGNMNAATSDRRGAVECNERRCRDDLPQAKAASGAQQPTVPTTAK